MKNTTYLILLISVFILSCKTKQQDPDSIPKHDSFKIKSEYVFENRIINVWTPPDYKKSTESFPVLYMPDGGIKEDFPHIANTIAELVKRKSIPPIILVGIENTERRRDLTGLSIIAEDEKYAPLSDGAEKFRSFIFNELFVEINKRYRTKDYKGLVGESLAGLFVVETFVLKPNMFDFYIAMDPSLWWNNKHLVNTTKEFLSNLPKKNKKLWFGGSSAKDISPHTKELAKILESESPKNLIWKYSDEPNEKHNTIFRATKEKAFIWILNVSENE